MEFTYDPDFVDSRLISGTTFSPLRVYVGKSVSLNCAVVYKVLECTPELEYLIEFAEQEYELARKYASPNICRVLARKKVPAEPFPYFCIVMERLERDWQHEIDNRRQSGAGLYPEKVLWERLYILIATLSALQQSGMAHRDIKPPNIFLHGSGFGLPKLGDFGSSREIENLTEMQTLQGTPFYLSPKAHQAFGLHRSKVAHNAYKSDVFSLGMTLFHAAFLELRPRWLYMNVEQLIQDFNSGFAYSENLRKYLFCMVTEKEEDRPDFLMLAQWLEIAPNLAYSLDAFKDWNVCCYQCGETSETAQKFASDCGHCISFCKEECFRQLCECAGENIVCKVCNSYVEVTLLRASLFVPVVTECLQMVKGTCEKCRRPEEVFQICHPICYSCAETYLKSLQRENYLLVCEVCKVRFPGEMLVLFDLGPSSS